MQKSLKKSLKFTLTSELKNSKFKAFMAYSDTKFLQCSIVILLQPSLPGYRSREGSLIIDTVKN